RTTWSDFLASTPSCTATSMDSSNLAVAASFTRASASLRGYSLVVSTLPCWALAFLVSLAISHALHVHAHRAGRAGDGAHGSIQIRGREVGHLGLGDLLELGARDLADLVGVRLGRALVQLDRLLDQRGRRRRLDDEGE